jgi:hypothetical protein
MIKIIWPEYIDLKYWAAAIVADYTDEILPILHDEKDWKDWGMVLCGTGIFAAANIPPPFSISGGEKKENFKSWQDWAKRVYSNMANELDIPKNIIG